jgi:hypothetical protein
MAMGYPLKQPGQREIYHPKVVVVAAADEDSDDVTSEAFWTAGGPRGTTDPFGLG